MRIKGAYSSTTSPDTAVDDSCVNL